MGEGEATPAMQPAKPAKPAKARKTLRERLDVLLTERGLAPSRERARALILAGVALVDGVAVTKAGAQIPLAATISLASVPDEQRFVSRGGLKLERALDAFALDPADRICLDVGASTGGFTDLLLRRGARRVYAVDVGHGQLAWELRNDARVVVMERTNIRHLTNLPEPVECVVIDVSFISLRLALPPVAALLAPAPGAWVVALVKPQFEAGRAEANRGNGVISDPAVHRRVLGELLTWLAAWQAEAPERALLPRGLVASPIAGRDGNHEYLLWLALASAPFQQAATGATAQDDWPARIEQAVATAFG